MSESCPECGTLVPYERRTCISCEYEIGFPNVRHALRESESLEARYQSVKAVAAAQNKQEVVKLFENAMSNSHVVMIRSVIDVVKLISNQKEMYMTFAQKMSGEGRIAENNEWDRARISVEPMIHPHFHSEIHYACLSLSDLGANDSSYGTCHLKLKESSIRSRTTVFEENAIEFVRKHAIVGGDPIPSGHRATWEQRQKLAVCKLSSNLKADTDPDEFDQILKTGSGKSADFIEAHIYGVMHASAVEIITVMTDECTMPEMLMLEAQVEANNFSLNKVKTR